MAALWVCQQKTTNENKRIFHLQCCFMCLTRACLGKKCSLRKSLRAKAALSHHHLLAQIGECNDLMPERGFVRTSGASQPSSPSFNRLRTHTCSSFACSAGGSAANAAAVSAKAVSPLRGRMFRRRVCRKRPLPFLAFPMFVPSLSW